MLGCLRCLTCGIVKPAKPTKRHTIQANAHPMSQVAAVAPGARAVLRDMEVSRPVAQPQRQSQVETVSRQSRASVTEATGDKKATGKRLRGYRSGRHCLASCLYCAFVDAPDGRQLQLTMCAFCCVLILNTQTLLIVSLVEPAGTDRQAGGSRDRLVQHGGPCGTGVSGVRSGGPGLTA